MFYAVTPVDRNEEEWLLSRVIRFAWDCELIRIARIGPELLLDLGDPEAADEQRLTALLGRVVIRCNDDFVPHPWRIVHQSGPED